MELETDDLKDKLEELRSSIKLLEYELETLEHNASISGEESSRTLKRAREDYEKAISQGNMAVTRTYETMIQAQEALESFRNSRSAADGSGKDSVLKALESSYKQSQKKLVSASADLESLEAEIENAVIEVQDLAQQNSETPLTSRELKTIEEQTRKSYQSALKKAGKAVSSAETALTKAQTAVEEYQTAQAESTQADLDAQEEELQAAWNTAREAYEDAVLTMNNSIDTAERDIEDSSSPKALTTEEELKKAEIDVKQKELKKLKLLEGSGGLVTAPVDAVVTGITAATGKPTDESEVFLLADTSKGMKFTASITKEEQKYVSKGDAVSLILNNDTILENLTISSIVPNAEDGDLMDVTLLLDYMEGISLGESAVLNVKNTSKGYSSCVPLQALNEDTTSSYVLAIKETASILGTVLEVERLDVIVQDKNSTYAALADGILADSTQIITDSDKTLKPGDRVRLAEE